MGGTKGVQKGSSRGAALVLNPPNPLKKGGLTVGVAAIISASPKDAETKEPQFDISEKATGPLVKVSH